LIEIRPSEKKAAKAHLDAHRKKDKKVTIKRNSLTKPHPEMALIFLRK